MEEKLFRFGSIVCILAHLCLFFKLSIDRVVALQTYPASSFYHEKLESISKG